MIRGHRACQTVSFAPRFGPYARIIPDLPSGEVEGVMGESPIPPFVRASVPHKTLERRRPHMRTPRRPRRACAHPFGPAVFTRVGHQSRSPNRLVSPSVGSPALTLTERRRRSTERGGSGNRHVQRHVTRRRDHRRLRRRRPLPRLKAHRVLAPGNTL